MQRQGDCPSRFGRTPQTLEIRDALKTKGSGEMPRKRQPNADPKLQGRQVVRELKRLYPEPACALVHKNPFQLLVATILSAQCTDARVNIVTPELFRRFPDAWSVADADQDELEALIRSTGFFRAKARNLKAMAERLAEQHDGEIPRSLETLTSLAGVGRKTANVVLGTAYGIASGIVVDTHVKRLAYRLGLTSRKLPEQIELDLMSVVPRSEWVDFSHRLIQHGRRTCLARKPRCSECALEAICPKQGVTDSR
jgi:endonuclease III